MEKAILVEITDGASHYEMLEDRCENLMDQRARWNYDFRLEGHEKEHCFSIEIVNRVSPDRKVFAPEIVNSAQQLSLSDERERWWANLMDTISQLESKSIDDTCTVWRFGGGAHFWDGLKGIRIKAFGEYDAIARHGHVLLVVEPSNLRRLEQKFPQSIGDFDITKEDEVVICEKW